MIESIQLAFGAVKGGLDIAQGFQSLKTEAAINQAIIDIQRSLLEAQRGLNEADTRHAADLKRIDELEQEIVRLKDWSAERVRYEAVSIYLGTIAYMPKLGMEDGKPPHWLCANCFERGLKSFLSFKGQDKGHDRSESTWGCDTCKSSIKVSFRTHPGQTQEKRLAAASSG